MALQKKTKVILTLVAFGCLAVVLFYDFSGERALTKQIHTDYSVHDRDFILGINQLIGPPLLEGNQAKALVNGVEIFPAMLEAIRNAEKSITFETYIYWSGQIGSQFSEVLSERARQGVKVHLLLDFIGCKKIDRKLLDQMKNSGVEVVWYHPVPWFTFANLNNRTHRKILVVDGKIAFTGGAGIADIWAGNADSPDHWRDTHFRFEGPAVAQMQAAFMDHWLETRGELLHGNDYFPPLQSAGNQRAQVFKSSPKEGSESARLMYLLSIASARKKILMSNAYFVPDDLSIKTFVTAAKRGVKIQIIAPGEITDTKFVRNASRDRWGDLLKAGIKIYEYQPTMYHCKVMVVDDIWSSVGSTNFDNRSFRLNDEVNLNIYDETFALQQTEIFQADLKKSRQITEEEWQNRSWFTKFKEKVAGLFHRQL